MRKEKKTKVPDWGCDGTVHDDAATCPIRMEAFVGCSVFIPKVRKVPVATISCS